MTKVKNKWCFEQNKSSYWVLKCHKSCQARKIEDTEEKRK